MARAKTNEIPRHQKVAAALVEANNITKRLFGVAATPALAIEVYDQMPADDNDPTISTTDEEDIDAFEADLKLALVTAQSVFGEVEPKLVLEVYSRQYLDDEDEDGYEEE